MAMEPLRNLTMQSAGSAQWMLMVAGEPKEHEYQWTKGNKSGTGRKLGCLLVSEDSTEYCPGVYKKAGNEPQATKRVQ